MRSDAPLWKAKSRIAGTVMIANHVTEGHFWLV
jgi:hypothetical protein